MHQIGGGTGVYSDFEFDPGDEWVRELQGPLFSGHMLAWVSPKGSRVRLVRWSGPPPSERPRPVISGPESRPPVLDRLQSGESFDTLWERDGLREIRFDSDGHCYITGN